MNTYLLKTFNGRESLESTITFESDSSLIKVCFHCMDISICKEDNYPFLALAKIREELEIKDLKILCKGSLLNVYPSGAALPFLKAYELQLGKAVTQKDLIFIFDPVSDVDKIATVKEQKAFYLKWLESVKNFGQSKL